MNTKENLPTEQQEMELINSFSRKKLKREDVYIFSVTLCDNEIDRDFEVFSAFSFPKLAELFTGKTGISDHSMRSRDQAARIFYCYTEKDENKKTSYGEAYTALKARAYMVRTKSNEDLIALIDGGIKKEVSVGCSMKKCTCSICGGEMKEISCEHIKGKTYEGKLCYGVLSDPSDAYEWSFVAVPAQRNAGVTKAYKKPQEEKMNKAIEVIKSAQGEVTLTKAQVGEIKAHLEKAEIYAGEAELYKSQLMGDIGRFSAIIMPGVDFSPLRKSCELMGAAELKKLRDELEKQAGEIFPVGAQLLSTQENKLNDNADFMI